MSEKKNSKSQYVFGATVLAIIAMFMFKGMFDNSNIKRNGVFVIGRVFKKVQSGNRLPVTHFYYFINGQRYEFGYQDGGVSDSLRMFKVLLSNPNKVVILDDAVPSCLEFKDVPAEGWKEVPVCGNVSQ
ncbi:hypothetical protein D3C72_1239490 [compost metagenome]